MAREIKANLYGRDHLVLSIAKTVKYLFDKLHS